MKCRKRNNYFSQDFFTEEKNHFDQDLDDNRKLWRYYCSNKRIECYERPRRIVESENKVLDSDDEFSFRHTILLPSKHHVINCLIQECNLTTFVKNCCARLKTLGYILKKK